MLLKETKYSLMFAQPHVFKSEGPENPLMHTYYSVSGFHNCIESCQPCPAWMGLFKQGKSPLFRKCCVHIIYFQQKNFTTYSGRLSSFLFSLVTYICLYQCTLRFPSATRRSTIKIFIKILTQNLIIFSPQVWKKNDCKGGICS